MTEAEKNDRHTRIQGKGVLQTLMVLVLLAAGVVGAVLLIKMRKPPEKIEQAVLAPLVKTKQVHLKDIQMVVSGYGTVKPKVEVDIVPEVPGKVVSIHPDLKVGGLILAGQQILKIDPRDYELAVQQANAAVAQAQVALDMERAEADVARREWSQLHPNTEPDSPLVLREPQIRQAEAAIESARAQLAIAQLKLDRTSISLPFDALITRKQVDLGQYIVVGQSLGSAYGIETVEIEVPFEDSELAWFDVLGDSIQLDGASSEEKRTLAQVTANSAGSEHTWQGYVSRTTGQVDRTSRMISVIIEVPKPFDTSAGRPLLMPGVFAEVSIQGRIIAGAVAVPRDAIRDGNKVWVVNDDRLHIISLDIVRADKDFAYVRSGLEDNTTIITSSLDAVVDGMQVRTEPNEQSVVQLPGKDSGEPSESEAN